MNKNRISLCTVSMNRLFTLKETLPGNIESCKGYHNVELALLDYHSTDGLETWVFDNFYSHICDGTVTFYKVLDPQTKYFSHSHSRNILFRLATGDILCNVNADYYIGDGFLDYLNDTMAIESPVALISDIDGSSADNLGRICVRKRDYIEVGGFDEKFNGYGYEDIDLSLRLKMSGIRLEFLPDLFYNIYISHEDNKRIENMYDYYCLKTAFVRKIDAGKSSVLFLYQDFTAEKGTLLKSQHDIPTIQEGGWLKGRWRQSDRTIFLHGFDEADQSFQEERSPGPPRIVGDAGVYSEIAGEINRKKVIILKSKTQNYQLLRNRRKSGVYRANEQGFGKATVWKNFQEKIVLE